MPAHRTFDYAIVRVVPRVERGEFVNVGVILSCPDARLPGGAHRARRAARRWRSPRRRPRGRRARTRRDPADLRRRRRRRARSARCRRASASTGWSRRAARSSSPRPSTPAAATISPTRSTLAREDGRAARAVAAFVILAVFVAFAAVQVVDVAFAASQAARIVLAASVAVPRLLSLDIRPAFAVAHERAFDTSAVPPLTCRSIDRRRGSRARARRGRRSRRWCRTSAALDLRRSSTR